MRIKIPIRPLIAFALCVAALTARAEDPRNVIWESPGTGANGSMPLGNGEVGLNLWVE